jgi:hypothetical protein
VFFPGEATKSTKNKGASMSSRTHVESTKPGPLAAVVAGLTAAAAITLAPAGARAQGAPPPPPAAAPGGYYAPPPGYYPPPGAYAQPQPGPRVLNDWEEGEPLPAGYHKATRPRVGLIVGGSVLFGVTWLTSAFAGAVASDIGARNGKLLIIPVVGPFTLVPSGSTTGDLFLVLDGLAQAGGLAMLVVGIAVPKTVAVRNDIAKVQIMPTPMTFGSNSAGFGFVGKF